MKINFKFEGVSYEADMSFYDTGVWTLPDGRVVQCAGWFESYPPQPGAITLFKEKTQNPFYQFDQTILENIASMMEGWNVFHNPSSDMFSDEYNERTRFSVRRSEAPFCGKNGDRQWNGSTPWEAIYEGMKSIKN